MTNETGLAVQAQGGLVGLPKPQESQEERMEKIAALMTTGDLSKMTQVQKNQFLIDLAKAHGLSPWPPPFMVIPKQGGGEILYATKSCADQLRKLHGISLEVTYEGPLVVGKDENPDVYVVRCKATDRDGRSDEEIGAVWIKGLVGENLSNAIMRAITKAKRRVTYTITGLSLPDETEVGSYNGGYSNQAVQAGPRQIQPGSRGVHGAGSVVVETVDALPPMEVPK